MDNLYKKVHKHLQPNERLVFPDMYKKTPWLYGKVSDTMYLIKAPQTEDGIDWVPEKSLSRAFDIYPNAQILAKLLLVELTDKSGDSPGWVMTYDEYQKSNKEALTILDTCLIAVNKSQTPIKIENLTVSEYQAFRDDYDIIGVAYFVRNNPVLGDT
jgi:hypothetical protein